MIYDFKCSDCGNETSESIPANDYDKYITASGRLKRRRCKKCKTISLYRHTIGSMSVVGEEGDTRLITIHFECSDCLHVQPLSIKTDQSFYMIEGQYLDEDKRSKTEKCEECNSDQIFYHNPTKAPAVLGGTKGYVSMERWQKMHPDHYKRKEEELQKEMGDRRRKKVLDKINKQVAGGKQANRHKGYGDGQGEQKLRSPDDK